MHLFVSNYTHRFPASISLQPERHYLADNHNAFNASLNYDAHFRCTYWNNPKPLDPSGDYNGKRIAIMRPAGIGDILFCTPLLHQIKRKWPDCVLTLVCMSKYWSLLNHNPDVDGLLTYPTPYDILQQNDAIVSLEGMLERKEAKTKHAIHLAADYCGMTLDEDNLRTRYFLQENELQWALKRNSKDWRKRLGIQWHTSCGTRNWDFQYLQEVLNKFSNVHDWEVFIFGEPTAVQVQQGSHKIINTTQGFHDIRESAALMKTCDAFLGMDSGLTHLAGAMGIPTIAVYGSYNPDFRTKHQPTVKSLFGKLPCSPCYSRDFVAGQPCSQSGKCEALRQITPQMVEGAILSL